MKLTKRCIWFFKKSDNSFGFSWWWVHAGLLTIFFGGWAIHLFPEKKFRRKFFTHEQELCHALIDYWGGGWLCLVTRLQ